MIPAIPGGADLTVGPNGKPEEFPTSAFPLPTPPDRRATTEAGGDLEVAEAIHLLRELASLKGQIDRWVVGGGLRCGGTLLTKARLIAAAPKLVAAAWAVIASNPFGTLLLENYDVEEWVVSPDSMRQLIRAAREASEGVPS